jgi:hypothetical protein
MKKRILKEKLSDETISFDDPFRRIKGEYKNDLFVI